MAYSQTTSEQIVADFLRTGNTNGHAANELADAIDHLVLAKSQEDLRAALRMARKLVARAQLSPRRIRVSAYRAHARAAHLSSRWAEAEASYLKARALANGEPMTRARIDRTLIDIYMYLENYREARKRASQALRTFERLGDHREIAKVKVNYANLLHRQDRHSDAERLYREAAEYFTSINDELAAARCLFNQANTLVQLFDFRQAEILYKKSEAIYLKHNHQLDAVDAAWGLSWLYMLQGRFHIALTELHACEEQYRRIGVPLRVASCELDRAEVYLNLNLYTAALDAARRAERMFARLATGYEAGKAALYRAQAAFVLHKRREGKAALQRATTVFSNARNYGFLGTACFLAYQFAGNKTERNRHLRRARRCFAKAQLPLWQAICDLHTARNATRRAAALAHLKRNPAVKVVPHLFAAWQTILGDREAALGHNAKAINHWARAADRLDRIRAALPPIGFRDTFARDLARPHSRLVNAELESRPMTAAIWSERNKTAGIWSPITSGHEHHPYRETVTRRLRELSEYVAAFSRYYGGIGERSLGVVPARRVMASLQRELMVAMVPCENADVVSDERGVDLVAAFRKQSQRKTIIQFHVSDNDVIAFVHRRGRLRIHKWPFGTHHLSRLVRQWRVILEDNALSSVLTGVADIADEHRVLCALGEYLWAPLEINRTDTDILVLPEGLLTNIPWLALRCHGAALGEIHRFSIAPSLRHFLAARRHKVRKRDIRAFVGKSEDLPAIEKDIQALRRHADTALHVYKPCRRDDLLGAEAAAIWHFSGHALLDKENPFYSALLLDDGPLFAADLRLQQKHIGLVTLAACQTGVSVALPGEESTGLVRSFLEMGARNVLAGHWPVADKSASMYMNCFYKELFSGATLTEAARRASVAVRERFASAYHWAAFAVFGAGS